MKIAQHCVAFTLAALICVSSGTHAAEPVVTLKLSPSTINPRNSEGDFIRLKDGRILFVYTRFSSGGSDHDKAVLASRVSHDQGQTWSDQDQVLIENEGDRNVMSVSLLRLHDGRIAFFYLQKNSLTDCRPVVRFSDDEAQTWSDPVGIVPDSEIGYHVLNNDRVIQLKNRRLVAPVAIHNRPGWKAPDWKGQITCYLSDDAGQTWRRAQTLQKAVKADGSRVSAQEPGVVQLNDDRLLLWVRTTAGEQYRSFSRDDGETWSGFEPMGIASPNSPATIERVPSTGDLLLVWNNHQHLPLEKRTFRTPFNLAVSRDDGNTWQHVKTLMDDAHGWYCYTALTFVDDHLLLGHCAGDRRTGGLNLSQITRVPLAWVYE